MTDREKLIGLIQNAVNGCARHWAEIIADYLLENGVVKVKHGKWIWKESYGSEWLTLVCSECEESEGANKRFNYCPHCGAKMDGAIKGILTKEEAEQVFAERSGDNGNL